MYTHCFDAFREALSKRLTRRAALAGIAGGAALTLAGQAATRNARAFPSSIAVPSPASIGATVALAGPAPLGTEILWDTWGVPHVYAEDAPGLFYAFGWAQAHNHGDLLLRLYAQGRGRAAEVYGESALASDRAARTMGLPARGAAGYEAQNPDFRANLDALAFDFSTLETTKQVNAFGGDAYVAAVEFGDPVRAFVLTTYGNASQPGSPHVGDQLAVSAKGELRPAWLSRKEVEANLEARDELG